MTMSLQSWRRIGRIVDEALDLAPEERAAHVARRCASDAELRREVEALLRRCEARHFLDLSAASFARPLLTGLPRSPP